MWIFVVQLSRNQTATQLWLLQQSWRYGNRYNEPHKPLRFDATTPITTLPVMGCDWTLFNGDEGVEEGERLWKNSCYFRLQWVQYAKELFILQPDRFDTMYAGNRCPEVVMEGRRTPAAGDRITAGVKIKNGTRSRSWIESWPKKFSHGRILCYSVPLFWISRCVCLASSASFDPRD
jgi:hypothetical protein